MSVAISRGISRNEHGANQTNGEPLDRCLLPAQCCPSFPAFSLVDVSIWLGWACYGLPLVLVRSGSIV